MRKRIRQIARGKFENEAPALLFPEEELSITVTEGQEYTGEFKIISTNHVPVRGVVYTSSSRMECLLTQFEGEEVRIRFQFHSRGLEEGETEKGDFVIRECTAFLFVYLFPGFMQKVQPVRCAACMILPALRKKTGMKPTSCFTITASAIL